MLRANEPNRGRPGHVRVRSLAARAAAGLLVAVAALLALPLQAPGADHLDRGRNRWHGRRRGERHNRAHGEAECGDPAGRWSRWRPTEPIRTRGAETPRWRRSAPRASKKTPTPPLPRTSEGRDCRVGRVRNGESCKSGLRTQRRRPSWWRVARTPASFFAFAAERSPPWGVDSPPVRREPARTRTRSVLRPGCTRRGGSPRSTSRPPPSRVRRRVFGPLTRGQRSGTVHRLWGARQGVGA